MVLPFTALENIKDQFFKPWKHHNNSYKTSQWSPQT
jgi:hypothetical protein